MAVYRLIERVVWLGVERLISHKRFCDETQDLKK